MSNKCPVCLKEFDERGRLLVHMKRVGHTIDGHKAIVCGSDEARMAAYHREKTGEIKKNMRYGK